MIIALVDCNNFYVSAERVFNRKIRNKPTVVLSNNDGCVISRSDEAKALGVQMGAPLHLIGDLVKKHSIHVFSSNYALYGDMSDRVMKTLAKFAQDIEIYSIDEAFLDLNMPYHDLPNYCKHIRETVRMHTGIPVSIGAATTKTLAKCANKYIKKTNKNVGVCILTDPIDIQLVLSKTAVEDVWGVGYQYSKMLNENNIHSALDLALAQPRFIQKKMTIQGLRTQRELNEWPCISFELQPPPKQAIVTSRSFGKSTSDKDTVREAIATFAAKCAEKLRKQNSYCSLVQVSLYTNRFSLEPQYFNSTSVELEIPASYTPDIIGAAYKIFDKTFKEGFNYKKAGVMVSGIIPADTNKQTLLFEELEDYTKRDAVMKKIDKLNKLFGSGAVQMADQAFKSPNWRLRQEHMSNRFTTRIEEFLRIKD